MDAVSASYKKNGLEEDDLLSSLQTFFEKEKEMTAMCESLEVAQNEELQTRMAVKEARLAEQRAMSTKTYYAEKEQLEMKISAAVTEHTSKKTRLGLVQDRLMQMEESNALFKLEMLERYMNHSSESRIVCARESIKYHDDFIAAIAKLPDNAAADEFHETEAAIFSPALYVGELTQLIHKGQEMYEAMEELIACQKESRQRLVAYLNTLLPLAEAVGESLESNLQFCSMEESQNRTMMDGLKDWRLFLEDMKEFHKAMKQAANEIEKKLDRKDRRALAHDGLDATQARELTHQFRTLKCHALKTSILQLLDNIKESESYVNSLWQGWMMQDVSRVRLRPAALTTSMINFASGSGRKQAASRTSSPSMLSSGRSTPLPGKNEKDKGKSKEKDKEKEKEKEKEKGDHLALRRASISASPWKEVVLVRSVMRGATPAAPSPSLMSTASSPSSRGTSPQPLLARDTPTPTQGRTVTPTEFTVSLPTLTGEEKAELWNNLHHERLQLLVDARSMGNLRLAIAGAVEEHGASTLLNDRHTEAIVSMIRWFLMYDGDLYNKVHSLEDEANKLHLSYLPVVQAQAQNIQAMKVVMQLQQEKQLLTNVLLAHEQEDNAKRDKNREKNYPDKELLKRMQAVQNVKQWDNTHGGCARMIFKQQQLNISYAMISFNAELGRATESLKAMLEGLDPKSVPTQEEVDQIRKDHQTLREQAGIVP